MGTLRVAEVSIRNTIYSSCNQREHNMQQLKTLYVLAVTLTVHQAAVTNEKLYEAAVTNGTL
jgi:hypothetical protein